MKLPETWAAARDPKWQRGAMGGDFIQHWLSYNKFDMAEDREPGVSGDPANSCPATAHRASSCTTTDMESERPEAVDC